MASDGLIIGLAVGAFLFVFIIIILFVFMWFIFGNNNGTGTTGTTVTSLNLFNGDTNWFFIIIFFFFFIIIIMVIVGIAIFAVSRGSKKKVTTVEKSGVEMNEMYPGNIRYVEQKEYLDPNGLIAQYDDKGALTGYRLKPDTCYKLSTNPPQTVYAPVNYNLPPASSYYKSRPEYNTVTTYVDEGL